MYKLNTDDTPLSKATYNPEDGKLNLVFDWDKLLDPKNNARHIDAFTFNGKAYEIEIHADNGPRDASGRYIYSKDTMENKFTIDIGKGHDPSSGILSFRLTDDPNGKKEINRFELIEVSNEPPIVVDTLAKPVLVAAVNAGGENFTAANGVKYEKDTYANGNVLKTKVDIAGTSDDKLYQSERWKPDGFTYDVKVKNGTYDVELNFAEIWSGAKEAGKRVFDIYVEDTLVFKDFDVSKEAGHKTAFDLIGEVEVTDGSLTITTSAKVQNPKISGFSIWESEGNLSKTFTEGSLYDDLIF